MLQVSKSVTVKRPREEVYRFWRNLENLPGFMYHVEAVSVTGDRSHWIVKAPGGTVEWDAEIVEEQPGERFTWRSLSGSAAIPSKKATPASPVASVSAMICA